jgi:hypothetical protein
LILFIYLLKKKRDLLRTDLGMEEFSGNFLHVFKRANVTNTSKLNLTEFLAIFKWNIDVRTE